MLEGIERRESRRHEVTDQYEEQCLVPTHACITKVRAELPAHRVDIVQEPTAAGEQQPPSHAEECEQHPKDVQEEEEERIGRRYDK